MQVSVCGARAMAVTCWDMCFLKLEPLTSEQTGVAVVTYADFRGPYFIAITPSFRDIAA